MFKSVIQSVSFYARELAYSYIAY